MKINPDVLYYDVVQVSQDNHCLRFLVNYHDAEYGFAERIVEYPTKANYDKGCRPLPLPMSLYSEDDGSYVVCINKDRGWQKALNLGVPSSIRRVVKEDYHIPVDAIISSNPMGVFA